MVASHKDLWRERSSLRTDCLSSHNRRKTCQGHQALLQRASAVLSTSREIVPLEAHREMYSLKWSPPLQPTPPRPASQRGVIEPAGVGAREAARVCNSLSARRVARRSAPPRPAGPAPTHCSAPSAWCVSSGFSLLPARPAALGPRACGISALKPSTPLPR